MRNLNVSAQAVPASSKVLGNSNSRSTVARPRVVSSNRAKAYAQSPLLEAAADAQPVAAKPPSSGAVVSPLVGKKVLQLSPGHSTVPLLHPLDDSLPFAASLHIISATAPASTSSRQHASNLVELHYVISGKGYFSNAASGVQQALAPGDSIISLHGAATFAAGPMPGSDGSQQQQQQQQGAEVQAKQGSSPAWSHLLGWLQQLHTKHQHQQQQPGSAQPAAPLAAASQGSSSQLVMLQLLLPSELLTGEMVHHHAGHAHAVAEQLPWTSTPRQPPSNSTTSASSSSLWDAEGDEATPAGSIHEVHVCGLLVDAGLASASHAEHSGQSTGQHQQHQQHQHTAGSGSQGGSAPGTSSSSAAHSFSSLRQQQCLKRALCDVGAFRLPQQTNRLALLFGPHASPAVCCSFGVEVFEPGHVTPLHIHNTAHELFFVLAGRGEAVFRYDGVTHGDASRQAQRVAVGPGDVAVFPPGVVHGVDNPGDGQLYCLQMMLPNEYFVEWVQSGQEAGTLDVTALQRLAAAASCG